MARHQATPEEGQAALRGHVVDRARAARARRGVPGDLEDLREFLADPECLRFPTELVFDDEPLLSGEFAWARPRGDSAAAGFDLVVHPRFRDRPADLALLVMYHVPSVNYLDIATHVEAELYGAAFFELEADVYYERICALADELPPGEADPEHRAQAMAWLAEDAAPAPGGGGGGAPGGCGCGAGGGCS